MPGRVPASASLTKRIGKHMNIIYCNNKGRLSQSNGIKYH